MPKSRVQLRSLLGDEKHFLAMFPRFSAGISTQQSSVDIFIFLI
jgi:hypothetical protein